MSQRSPSLPTERLRHFVTPVLAGIQSHQMRRFPIAFRLLAVTLLLCIGQDLAADALCAPPFETAFNADTMTAATADSCATVCVPDCFCCCIGVESDDPVAMTDFGPVASRTELHPASPLDGASVSIFHPPLLRA
jgi:hypothetical protein